MTTVGVVIPCRNEALWIGEVLDALAEQDRRPDAVVVVDDGSTDGTAEAVRSWASSRGPEVRGGHGQLSVRLVAGPGRGVAAAVNAGIAALDTDVIVRLDGHCRPTADYVRRTVALATEPGVGVAGGAWTIVPSASSLEAQAIAIAVGHPFGSGGAEYRRAGGRAAGRAGEKASPRADEEASGVGRAGSPARPPARSVDTVPFGCFRRSLWLELGGLEERLWSNEDYDFNFRVRQYGLRVMLDSGIRCAYYARPTVRALARQYGRYGWWKARMLVHHPKSIRWRQLIPALLVPVLLAGALGTMMLPGPLWPLLLACYPAAVLAGAVHAAATRRAWSAGVWIAAAFFAIQIFWSVGFWASVLSGGPGKGGGTASPEERREGGEANEPRARSGAVGAPASDRARGSGGTKSPGRS